MYHTKKPYTWVYGQLIFWVEVLTQCCLEIASWPFSSSNFAATFSSISSNENTWKDFLVGLFKLSPALGMICVNKNMHLAMQHPSSGAMTAGPTDTSEILIPMPMPGQEPSTYICLSPAKIADFMHPKWERCIVINSLVFVVVCKNILYCLNLEPASNKKRMTGYIKNPHTNIFIGQTGFGKTQLVLELIEKE